jgi:iron-sulfur cluster assembly accessory protein
MKITFTQAALDKIHSVNEKGQALRLGVRGGGCSGYAYSMEFTDEPKGEMDKEFLFGTMEPHREQKVYVDAVSGVYLDGTTVDYVETLEASGFKFLNPNAKSTCGCGSSFGA